MGFKVPEKFRVRDGRLGSDASYGNNGAFEVKLRHGQTVFVIASDGEQWCPIEGYEGFYEVSTLGRVRALERVVDMPNGASRRHDQHLVAEEVMDKGYVRVSLCRDGKIDKKLVHVLVAEAFIGKVAGFDQVNHRNGNKSSNCVDNLELCSQEYNMHHAIESGLRSGLTAERIEHIKSLLDSGMSPTEVALEVGVSRQRASNIKFGRHRDLNPAGPIRWSGIPHWEHVSVSRKDRCPTWDEMCQVRVLFWGEDDWVTQFHPPKDQYVNNHPYCLHLWRCPDAQTPVPHSFMVGIKELA